MLSFISPSSNLYCLSYCTRTVSVRAARITFLVENICVLGCRDSPVLYRTFIPSGGRKALDVLHSIQTEKEEEEH